ncbi:MAG: LCP family protein [Tuberibacillus sp.]
MDNELKQLKNDLNQTLYRGRRFSEKHKMKIRENIYQSGTQIPFKRFKSVMSLAVCFALLMALGSFVYRQMATPGAVNPSEKNVSTKAPEVHDMAPFAFLYVLHSQREHLGTVMVVAVNPGKKTVALLSLPPRLDITEKSGKEAVDLEEASIQKELNPIVSDYLQIPVKYTMEMYEASFQRMIDEAGGVDVNSPFDFSFNGIHIKKGKGRLNGREALAYFTMVKMDPQGALGREKRQHEVIKSLLQRVSVEGLISYLDKKPSGIGSDSWVKYAMKETTANDFSFQSFVLGTSIKNVNGRIYEVPVSDDIKRVKAQLKRLIQN